MREEKKSGARLGDILGDRKSPSDELGTLEQPTAMVVPTSSIRGGSRQQYTGRPSTTIIHQPKQPLQEEAGFLGGLRSAFSRFIDSFAIPPPPEEQQKQVTSTPLSTQKSIESFRSIP